MKLKKDRIIALALGAALVTGFIISQRPHPPATRTASAATGPAKPVAVATAEKVAIEVLSDGVGTVRSRRQTQIAARVLAEVKEIRKQPGDAVEEGDTLIVLDSLDLKARVDQADANLRSLEENLKEAQTDFDRKKNLLEKQAVTQQEYDVARFQLAAVTARREAAQKTLEEARIQLGYATIVAPFKGLVYEKSVDPGDIVTPGKPLLGLYDPGQLRLEALVEEALLWKVRVKDTLPVKIEALDDSMDGVVSEAVPAVDPSTRTGTIKIDLPANVPAKPGMFGRARIPSSRREAIVVPAAAVVRRGQLELAFAVRGGARAGERLARMLLVRSGPRLEKEPGKVEVLTGLVAGETVVVSGAEDLRDGDLLEVAGGTEGSGR